MKMQRIPSYFPLRTFKFCYNKKIYLREIVWSIASVIILESDNLWLSLLNLLISNHSRINWEHWSSSSKSDADDCENDCGFHVDNIDSFSTKRQKTSDAISAKHFSIYRRNFVVFENAKIHPILRSLNSFMLTFEKNIS